MHDVLETAREMAVRLERQALWAGGPGDAQPPLSRFVKRPDAVASGFVHALLIAVLLWALLAVTIGR